MFKNKFKKISSEAKVLWKPFLLIFLISFLVINWNSVSWAFNYKVISQIFSGFFQEIFSQGLVEKPTENKVNKEKTIRESEISGRENSLEVPKIGIIAPLILVEKESQLKIALDRGVVLYPQSSLPEEPGQTIILGHSAPPNWPKIKYDWVFSRISELEEDDEILLHFNHQKFRYLVKKKIFLDRGEELPQRLTNSGNSLVLISCWPPGQNVRRIAIVAE